MGYSGGLGVLSSPVDRVERAASAALFIARHEGLGRRSVAVVQCHETIY